MKAGATLQQLRRGDPVAAWAIGLCLALSLALAPTLSNAVVSSESAIATLHRFCGPAAALSASRADAPEERAPSIGAAGLCTLCLAAATPGLLVSDIAPVPQPTLHRGALRAASTRREIDRRRQRRRARAPPA